MKVIRMKLRIAIPIVMVLVLLVAACAPPPPLRNEQLLHDDSFVSGDPCGAPCWRGITPGETTWDDALQIIKDDPTLSEPEIQEGEGEESNAKLAVWNETDGQMCCQMFTKDSKIVESLVLLVAPDIRLSEVIERHGDPVYVIGTEVSEDQAVMNLFYLDPPMLLYAFVPGKNGALSQSSEVVGVLYLSPDSMTEVVESNSLPAWDGYQSFQAYADADFAVTAIPSATPTEEK